MMEKVPLSFSSLAEIYMPMERGEGKKAEATAKTDDEREAALTVAVN